MSLFIRLDEKGTWMGEEHISCGAWTERGDKEDNEGGVSCYCLDNKADGLDQLYDYWINHSSLEEKEYNKYQITIFEGYYVGMGSSWEDVAICEKTIKELDKVAEVFDIIYDAKEKLEGSYYNEELDDFEEITEEEYNNILESIEL